MNRDTEITRVANTELCIHKGASDRTLFMLHGIGGNYTSFNQLSGVLPSDVTLVAWNAPGYGNSAPVRTQSPTACDYVHRLHDVVEQLGLTNFTLLGHSLGTLIATQYAYRFPETVDALILVSCAEGYGMQKGATLPAKTQQRLTDLNAKGPRVFAQERAPKLLYRPEARPELCDAAIDAMASINPDGYAQAVHMLSTGKLSHVAGNTSVRSLIFAGVEDQITPMKQGRLCHEALLSASSDNEHVFEQVPDAGHLVHQEQAVVVANGIEGFLGWGALSRMESTA